MKILECFEEIDGSLQDIDNVVVYMGVPEKAKRQILRATDRISYYACKWLDKESKRLDKKFEKKHGKKAEVEE